MIGSFTLIDRYAAKYDEGYDIEFIRVDGDTIPYGFLVSIDKDSKIVKDAESPYFDPGKWEFHFPDTSKFEVYVEKAIYVTGKRNYVHFYYDDERLDKYSYRIK